MAGRVAGAANGMEAMKDDAEKLRDQFLTWAAIIDDLLSGEAPSHRSVDPVPKPQTGIVAATEEIAVHVIEAMGKPMSTRELLPIVSQHITVAGKVPLSTLSARLSGSKRLVRTRDGWDVKR
jgi:hypothetical protein